MKLAIHHPAPIPATYRSARVASLFNIVDDADFRLEMEVDLDARPWQIGLIVGPSGTGKTSAAKALFGGESKEARWPDAPLIEAIAPGGDFNQVTGALAAVGLGSVPSWLRPYAHLSNGEQFRAGLARLLCERPALAVVDEFTSTIDRRVARIGAGAFAKAWRRGPVRRSDLPRGCDRLAAARLGDRHAARRICMEVSSTGTINSNGHPSHQWLLLARL